MKNVDDDGYCTANHRSMHCIASSTRLLDGAASTSCADGSAADEPMHREIAIFENSGSCVESTGNVDKWSDKASTSSCDSTSSASVDSTSAGLSSTNCPDFNFVCTFRADSAIGSWNVRANIRLARRDRNVSRGTCNMPIPQPLPSSDSRALTQQMRNWINANRRAHYIRPLCDIDTRKNTKEENPCLSHCVTPTGRDL
jgi:hypothetical protein